VTVLSSRRRLERLGTRSLGRLAGPAENGGIDRSGPANRWSGWSSRTAREQAPASRTPRLRPLAGAASSGATSRSIGPWLNCTAGDGPLAMPCTSVHADFTGRPVTLNGPTSDQVSWQLSALWGHSCGQAAGPRRRPDRSDLVLQRRSTSDLGATSEKTLERRDPPIPHAYCAITNGKTLRAPFAERSTYDHSS
jgi:hypothetical protein